MNEKEILRQARAALAAGKDPAAVDQHIAELTGGKYGGMEALARAQQSASPGGLLAPGEDPTSGTDPRYNPASDEASRQAHARAWGGNPTDPETAALLRQGQRRGGALRDFGRMAAQGATFGLADEIAGGAAALGALVPGGRSPGEAYRETTDASRQYVEDLRTLNPGASLASEAAGGLTIPGLGAWGATRGAVTGGRIGSAALRGAGTGAAEGALYGFGSAEGNPLERLPSAGTGAAFGGAGGGLLGGTLATLATGARAMRSIPKVSDIAQDLAARVGIGEGGEISHLRELADATVQRVRREHYDVLEEAFPEVDDEIIVGLLRGERGGTEIQGPIRWATRRVMGRDGMESGPPSFRQLQSILKRLRGKASKAAKAGDPAEAAAYRQAQGELRAAMEQRLPGFAQAQAAFRRASSAQEAFDEGVKLWGRGSTRNRPEDMRAALDALPTDEARANFRSGMAAKAYDELAKSGDVLSASQVQRNISPAMRERYQVLFPRRQDYREFMRLIEDAGDIYAARDMLRKVAIGFGIVGGGALGGKLGQGLSLFD